ncbi:unnamed protein product [Ectocarpus sp. CCAP 1310/34]|nr:unnamed protein product [Ectocarpus sp. CCAP 1310/34]
MAGLFDQQTTSGPRSRTHVTNPPHSSSDASDGGRRFRPVLHRPFCLYDGE